MNAYKPKQQYIKCSQYLSEPTTLKPLSINYLVLLHQTPDRNKHDMLSYISSKVIHPSNAVTEHAEGLSMVRIKPLVSKQDASWQGLLELRGNPTTWHDVLACNNLYAWIHAASSHSEAVFRLAGWNPMCASIEWVLNLFLISFISEKQGYSFCDYANGFILGWLRPATT
eukprot:scaffold59155_cov18-Tisochrysis_lutea.AAC.2